ncbi:MAG TPA: nitroreductase [Longimicrobiales bacterium]|nr:nitroreductase [Longimicrobiales bacterium]
MDVIEAIARRRSVKEYEPEPVPRETIERLLELAILAPNHRMTEPWGFFVLGDAAKERYGHVRARFKTLEVADGEKAQRKRARILEETVAIPAILAVSSYLDDDPVTREEDYAAVFMAIQNILLAAQAFGLGAKIHTGRILEDDELRAALDVPREHRLVAILHLGKPRELPALKPRRPASEVTHWLP